MKKLQFRGPARVLRLRGRRVRRGRSRPVQGRRGHRHPLRGPQGRPRHARDAVDHGSALRPGHGREGRADHRRPLLRRHARLLHRPRRAGGGGRRADRPAEGRRHHRRSMPRRARSTSSSTRPSSRRAGRIGRPRTIPIRAARCASTPSRSGLPTRARLLMLAAKRKWSAMRIFDRTVRVFLAGLLLCLGTHRCVGCGRQVPIGAGRARPGYRRLQRRLLRDRHSGARVRGRRAPVLRALLSGAHLLGQQRLAHRPRQGLRALSEDRRGAHRRRSRRRPARAVRRQGDDAHCRLSAQRPA